MYLGLTVVLLLAYFINLVFGLLLGNSIVGDVGEALLLFATALAFVTLILEREAQARQVD